MRLPWICRAGLPLTMARRWRGFTLLELATAMTVASILVAIAIPAYRSVMEGTKVSQATEDLTLLASAIERYRSLGLRLPDSIEEFSNPPLLDPWGHPYQYLNFDSGAPGVNGKIRKDHNLHPLNSEYDLYSMGPDGDSAAPLTASKSRDDIVWARDGAFIGKASEF
ncbi:MAG: prepilin-type N-terminal cleavage/methylation domain-containing protein [Steroidobacteraceae bacterium]